LVDQDKEEQRLVELVAQGTVEDSLVELEQVVAIVVFEERALATVVVDQGIAAGDMSEDKLQEQAVDNWEDSRQVVVRLLVDIEAVVVDKMVVMCSPVEGTPDKAEGGRYLAAIVGSAVPAAGRVGNLGNTVAGLTFSLI
jgi:hypothetical protein